MSLFHRIPRNAIYRGITFLASSLCLWFIPNSSVIQWQNTKLCAKCLAKPEAPVYANLKVITPFRFYQAFAWREVQTLRVHFGFVQAPHTWSMPQRSVWIIVLSLGTHTLLRRINILSLNGVTCCPAIERLRSECQCCIGILHPNIIGNGLQQQT